MERGSDLKHLESGGELDAVLFADRLDNGDPKRLLCVPIPFRNHCVTVSLSLVLVIFFPVSLCLCHPSDPPPRTPILFSSSSIN